MKHTGVKMRRLHSVNTHLESILDALSAEAIVFQQSVRTAMLTLLPESPNIPYTIPLGAHFGQANNQI